MLLQRAPWHWGAARRRALSPQSCFRLNTETGGGTARSDAGRGVTSMGLKGVGRTAYGFAASPGVRHGRVTQISLGRFVVTNYWATEHVSDNHSYLLTFLVVNFLVFLHFGYIDMNRVAPFWVIAWLQIDNTGIRVSYKKKLQSFTIEFQLEMTPPWLRGKLFGVI